MKKENIFKISTFCDVCKKEIFVDQFGNGKPCSNCGWQQSEESFQHPFIAGIRNIPSLHNAKKQYENGKSAILANFDDFIETYKNYGEVEFTYQNIRYGILYNDLKKCDMLLNINTKKEQLFKSIDELVEKANINGILLKDLWQDVTNTNFLQEFN